MKHILEFIEKHKTFFKQLFKFTIFVIAFCLLNNPVITQLFTQIFGEFVTPALCASPLVLMSGSD